MKTNRDFKGIWIPKEIWENKNLSLQEKVFYVEIDSLNNENGCFASNDYFANFFDLSKKRVSMVIQELIKKSLITSEVLQENGNTRILKTIPENGVTLSPKTSIPLGIKRGDPIPENGEHNNTVNNKLNNTVIGSTPAEQARKFFTDLKEIERVEQELREKGIPNQIVSVEINKFISYWTEPTKSGKKQKWETQETFEIGRRLATWFRNFDKFTKNNSSRTRKVWTTQ